MDRTARVLGRPGGVDRRTGAPAHRRCGGSSCRRARTAGVAIRGRVRGVLGDDHERGGSTPAPRSSMIPAGSVRCASWVSMRRRSCARTDTITRSTSCPSTTARGNATATSRSATVVGRSTHSRSRTSTYIRSCDSARIHSAGTTPEARSSLPRSSPHHRPRTRR